MNLDGIAAAHGDMRLRFALEIREIAFCASAALWIAVNADGLHVAAPNVAGEQAAKKSFRAAGEKLEGFGHLPGGDEIHDGAEHANGVAGFFEGVRGIAGFEKAGEARGQAGTNGHGEAVAGNTRSVDPRQAGLHGKIIDQKTGLKVIGAIEEEIAAGEKLFGILRPEIGDDTPHGDAGIDGEQLALGGNGFWKSLASIRLVKESLALEIGRLDEIPVNDFDGPDTGTNKKVCGSSAYGATTNDGGARSQQPLLAFGPDSGEEHLSGVFFLERIGHGWCGPSRTRGRGCQVTS